MDNNTDLGSMLSGLLSDPETLAKVMSIAGELGKGMNPERSDVAASAAPPVDNPTVNSAPTKGNDATAETFAKSDGNIPDLSSLSALGELLGGGSKKHDPRCDLLRALRPYMGHGRAEKIDAMIKALGLAELAGGFLKNQKLF